jgi:hypothetical protein
LEIQTPHRWGQRAERALDAWRQVADRLAKCDSIGLLGCAEMFANELTDPERSMIRYAATGHVEGAADLHVYNFAVSVHAKAHLGT